MPAALPPIAYASRDFAKLVEIAVAYVQATAPNFITDFTESNIGMILLRLNALIGDIQGVSIDRASEENFPDTIRQYASMLRFGRSVGFRPVGPKSASVDVTAQAPLPPELATQAMTIPAGTSISAGNDVAFEVPETISFPAGTTVVVFTMSAGRKVVEQTASSGIPNLEVISTNPNVVDGSWLVEVDGVEWTESASTVLAGGVDTYTVDYDSDNRILIRFGDGTYGNIPPVGSTITVTYRVGGGSAGNIPANTINQNISVSFPIAGIKQLSVTNLTSAGGGADRSTLAELKRFIPAFIRTVDHAVTQEDFNTLARQFSDPTFGAIGKALARLRASSSAPTIKAKVNKFSDLPAANPADFYIVLDTDGGAPNGSGIYQWNGAEWVFQNLPLVLSQNTVDVFVWVPDGNDSFTTASLGLKTALYVYLKARSMISLEICVVDGGIKPVNVNIGTVLVDTRFDPAEVQANVEAALATLFNSVDFQPGSTMLLKSIWQTVANVDGVVSFTISSPTIDTLAGMNEMLVLGTVTSSFIAVPPDPAMSMSGACPPADLRITTSSLAAATIGVAYAGALAAAGGAPGYVFSVDPMGDNLPTGLSLSAAGVLSGTPSGVVGVYDVVFRVTDSVNNFATRLIPIRLLP